MRGILCERRACNARQSCFLDATLSRYCTSNGTGRPLDFLLVQAVPAMSRCAHFILRVKRCRNTAPMVAPASPGPRVAMLAMSANSLLMLSSQSDHIGNSQARSPLCRSEEHTSELQSLMRTPYAVLRL